MKSNQHKVQYTLVELTAGLDVTIKGNPDCVITGVGTIQLAQPDQITFLMNPLYKKHLAETQASAVILTEQDSLDCPVNAIISRDPYYTYAKIAAYFEYKPSASTGVHPSAIIEEGCEIDKTANIGAFCVIKTGAKIGKNVSLGASCIIGEDVEIGDDCRLDPNITLYFGVKLGKRVNILSGAVIGSDGFGFAKHKGVWQKVPQLGSVIIGDDVDIGSNCSIDRGAIENTIIENSVKIDNLVQIGHNVRIGESTAIAGCVGISGSTTIGKNCLIGGACGFAGHIHIADNVMITGLTAVTKSIKEPGIYSSGVGGLMTNQEWRKNSARLHRLDKLTQRVKLLESVLEELIERKET